MAAKATVLVVDDQEETLALLQRGLKGTAFETVVARSAGEATDLFTAGHFDLVVLSLVLLDRSSLSVLDHVHSTDPSLPVIVMADPTECELVGEAIKKGAYNWVPKVVDIEKLSTVIDSLVAQKGLLVEPVSLEGGLREEPGLKKIIGSSEKIKDVFKIVEAVVASDVPVLIQGETGTGKELVAKAVHYRGPRRKHPFRAVNCAAIPENLLESELFGHEKGAFTGATEARKGKFEDTHMGTLFLDEIADMASSIQAKVLRVIEEKSFERVGGNKQIHVDVRIVSATNKDLWKEVREGTYREDLYYRLADFPIKLPALRERRKDIPELAGYFLDRFGNIANKSVTQISDRALEALVNYHWPGNVRQLQNCIRRAVLLAPSDTLEPEHFDLPVDVDEPVMPEAALDNEVGTLLQTLQTGDVVPLYEVEGVFIKLALSHTNGNITEAADRLGISRSTIYRKLQEHGVSI